MADLIDAELSAGEKTVKSLIKTAHTFGVKVVVSNHDFGENSFQRRNRGKTSEDAGTWGRPSQDSQ